MLMLYEEDFPLAMTFLFCFVFSTAGTVKEKDQQVQTKFTEMEDQHVQAEISITKQQGSSVC